MLLTLPFSGSQTAIQTSRGSSGGNVAQPSGGQVRGVRVLPSRERVASRCFGIEIDCRVAASVSVLPAAGLFDAYLQ